MNDCQKIMIEEKIELDKKIDALRESIDAEKGLTVIFGILTEQKDAMMNYSGILAKRIGKFTAENYAAENYAAQNSSE